MRLYLPCIRINENLPIIYIIFRYYHCILCKLKYSFLSYHTYLNISRQYQQPEVQENDCTNFITGSFFGLFSYPHSSEMLKSRLYGS